MAWQVEPCSQFIMLVMAGFLAVSNSTFSQSCPRQQQSQLRRVATLTKLIRSLFNLHCQPASSVFFSLAFYIDMSIFVYEYVNRKKLRWLCSTGVIPWAVALSHQGSIEAWGVAGGLDGVGTMER